VNWEKYRKGEFKMARVTIEDCLERVESRFALVHLAVRRVLQLRKGAPSLMDVPKNKEVVVALREIAAGRITTDNVRQFDELESLETPMAAAKAQKIMHEVEEILEASSKYAGAIEFDGKQVKDLAVQENNAED
jgi:DNA-directed RNA polymerase subunit omega